MGVSVVSNEHTRLAGERHRPIVYCERIQTRRDQAITTRYLIIASLLLSACSVAPPTAEDKPERLTFVHLNDTYRVGAVEDGTRGGFGRVVTLVRDLQGQGRDVRILHGGDFLYPSLESQLWNGEQMVEAFNFMDDLAPMFIVAGNHEFDRRTPAQLIDAVRASRFDWLGDNYRFDTGAADVDSALRSGFTYQHGDRTVGIFSLTLGPSDGGNDRAYVPVDSNYLEIAKAAIEALEAKGADVIIGVTHLHMATDVEIAKLKAEHPRLAFIVGGHEHEPQYSPGSETSAVVMKGASNARVIWQIDVTFDGQEPPVIEPRQIPVDESLEEDADYAAIDRKWRSRLLELYPFLESPIGRAALPMDATEETIRNNETSWGNFVADQMPGAFGDPAADLAFINSGTLRIDDTIADDIVFEDIARTFGFSSFLRFLTISGVEFRTLMEAGYRGEGDSKGYFPQVSGFRVCVDKRRDDFDRIVSLQVPMSDGWQEIDPQREYTLVMPDYLFGGGDGYQVPEHRKNTASRPASELKYLVLDAIVRAQAAGIAIGEPVDPANPRYAELGENRERCW